MELDIVDQILSVHDFKFYSVSQLPELVVLTMEIVEKIVGLDGPGKKRLAIAAINRIVDESNLAGSWEPVILPMVPVLIEGIVRVSKGDVLNVKKPVCCW